MAKLSVLLVLAAAAASVNAHYYVSAVNGLTGPLRPIALRQGGENTPVTGSQIETDDMICNVARPFNAKASQPLSVAAGSTLKVQWDTSVFHTGPCHVYIGEGLKPAAWAKIFEIRKSPQWCSDVINANGNVLNVPIPASLAPGEYVVRVDHIGLHSAGSAGGAQFYPRCLDIVVTGSGTLKPPYNVPIPGSWTGSTPGVLYNLYTSSNGQPPVDYPYWGGQLWDGKTGSSSGPTSPAATSPRTSPQTSPRTSPRTSPQTSPSLSPSPAAGCVGNVALYSQCGGSTYTGSKCCQSGLTCKFVNTYYSQCVQA